MKKSKIKKPENANDISIHNDVLHTRYEYTITNDNRISIRDIVIATDIVNAYELVMSVISNLNKKSDECKWELETLVNTELTLGC